MGWSYRNDRSDEVYSSSGGPAAATTEQMPRPPADGEDTDAVLNPEVAEPKKGEEKVAVDPEAGKPVPTPEEQAKLDSEQVVRLSELETTRQENMEKDRIRMAERQRLEQEEKDKEHAEIVKTEQAQVKKEVAAEAAADKKEANAVAKQK